jgi:hypothetical protein
MRDTSKLALSRASHWKERFMEGGRYLSVNWSATSARESQLQQKILNSTRHTTEAQAPM